MRPDLSSIQEFVQQVVEAIAVALGIEVMVFDLERNIVAGTGVTKMEIGGRYDESSLTGSILAVGHPLITRAPGSSDECVHCSRYGVCPFYVVVAYPIKVGKNVLGSFCLVAIDENQKQRILSNEQTMLTFLDKACQLVGSAINERQMQDELNILVKRYDNVVNSVADGIIVTDEMGRVIHLSLRATEFLGVELDGVQGTHIKKLFPELPFSDVQQRKQVVAELSYLAKSKRKKQYFFATIMPILSEDGMEFRGSTISLRNLNEVQSYATKLVGGYSRYRFEDIHGESEEILLVKKKLQKAARTDSTILVRGESGTGKELLVQAVHSASYRSKGPFVAINCSAIPELLMESELFGYEEGAFTGAKRGGKPGKFELAAGGTLFLDEIGDMPLHLQSKLLRVLENRCIERIGGITSISMDVRIIAATNRDLEEMVEQQEFREDLYYRLSVIPVFVPPLRERKKDIMLLIEHFLEKYSKIMNREPQEMDKRALNKLIHYSWPGNVRELQNTVEYAINMSEPGQPILLEHLPQRVLFAAENEVQCYEQEGRPEDKPDGQDPRLKTLEIELIKEAVERFGNTTVGKETAAKYLGISRATLYRRLKGIC